MFSFILAGPNGEVKYLYFKNNLFCEIFFFILQMFLTFTLGDLSVSWAAKTLYEVIMSQNYLFT